MKRVLVLLIATIFLAGSALAVTPQKKRHRTKTAANASLTEVKVCPINGEAIEGKGAGSEVVGNYKVYFCCADHKAEFNRLSKEEKEKRVAEALQKQNSKKS